jgi:hypothetical protein
MNTTTKTARIVEIEPMLYQLEVSDNRVKEIVDTGHYSSDLWVKAIDLGVLDENIAITNYPDYTTQFDPETLQPVEGLDYDFLDDDEIMDMSGIDIRTLAEFLYRKIEAGCGDEKIAIANPSGNSPFCVELVWYAAGFGMTLDPGKELEK